MKGARACELFRAARVRRCRNHVSAKFDFEWGARRVFVLRIGRGKGKVRRGVAGRDVRMRFHICTVARSKRGGKEHETARVLAVSPSVRVFIEWVGGSNYMAVVE